MILLGCGFSSHRDDGETGGVGADGSGAGGSSESTNVGGRTSRTSERTAGGSSLGGTSAGGSSLGGTSAGGSSLGGTSAGGSSLGGTSAGGSSLGGTSAGGVSAGGTSTGGTTHSCTGIGEDVFVDPQSGNDVDSGSRSAPLKTIERAGAVASSRCAKTIWLLDGTYDSATEPRFTGSAAGICGQNSGVILPPDVALRAEHAGRARLVIGGAHGLCVSGGRVSGLEITRPSLGGPVLETGAGRLDVDATTFDNCGYPGVSGLIAQSETANSLRSCVVVSKDANVHLMAQASHPWLGSSVGTFATVVDDGRLETLGGQFHFAPRSASMVLFATAHRAELALSNSGLTSAIEHDGVAIQLQDGAKASLTGTSTVAGFGMVCNVDSNAASLLLEEVTAERNLYFAHVNGAATGKTNVTLRSTQVTDAKTAVLIQSGEVSLLVEDSELSANTAGILSYGTGTVSVVDSRITDNDIGMLTQPAGGTYSVYLRRTRVSNNATVGVLLGGTLDGTYDLGTLAAPGDNVFIDNASTNGASLSVSGGHPIRIFRSRKHLE
ncbi:MAG: DUF1565 domain-containing protein [Polyangiaceae bacterium]